MVEMPGRVIPGGLLSGRVHRKPYHSMSERKNKMENQEEKEIKLSVEEPSRTKRVLKVEVPTEEIELEFKKTYQNLQKKVKFPGFRPGKTPISMIRSRLSRDVHEDLLQRIIPDYYAKALEKSALKPVDMPIIRNVHLSEGEPFCFDATVYIKPKFEVKDYKGVPRSKKETKITDEMVDRVIRDMQERLAELSAYEDEDHQVVRGDVAEADIEGFVDGKPIERGKGTGQLIEVGEGKMIAGLEDGFLGMKKGEAKEIPVTFPENYHAAGLSGAKAVFKVNLKDIKQKKLPALDDEFAKDVGERFGTLNELKAEVRKGLEAEEAKRIREDLHLEIMDEVLRRNPIEELPEIMIERQKKALKESFKSNLHRSGKEPKTEEIHGVVEETVLDKKARRDVAWSFIIEQLAEKEGIKVTPDEVESALGKRAWESSMSKEVLRDLYMKQVGSLEPFRLMLLNEKILDFLLENAKVTGEDVHETEGGGKE
ncbi:MAG: trigger factor [Nitrospirae bacterium CG17_big_fil_post_rev_8_21_14_2_50_50_9]|nr:MAG: trigger factor [Nitrospirae bacterium CG17_big_fil_post_rev_8_21_14_2_50_50_9]